MLDRQNWKDARPALLIALALALLQIATGWITYQQSTRKLTQMVNKLKIETSISLRMRDEEVEIHGKSNCWDIGRR